MSNFFSSLFASTGLKRMLASGAAALAAVVAAHPVLAPALPLIQWLAGLLGATGVIHATAEGTLTKLPSASLSSFLSALVLIFQNTPALQPYLSTVALIASFFGVGALVSGATKQAVAASNK